jgi:hypothetical protein
MNNLIRPVVILFSFLIYHNSSYCKSKSNPKLFEIHKATTLEETFQTQDFIFTTTSNVTLLDPAKGWLKISNENMSCHFSRETDSKEVILLSSEKWISTQADIDTKDKKYTFQFEYNNKKIKLTCEIFKIDYFFREFSRSATDYNKIKQRCIESEGELQETANLPSTGVKRYECKKNKTTYADLKILFSQHGLKIDIKSPYRATEKLGSDSDKKGVESQIKSNK